jgi:tetratricopeptide (TPR) repeat protein
MRRLILAAALLVTVFASASPAEAFWHHRWGCWGWRWGYGGWCGPRWGCYRVAYGYYPGCWNVGVPVCYGPYCGSYTIGATVGYVGPGYGLVTPAVPVRSSILVLRPATGGACAVPPPATPERGPKASPAPAAPAPAAPAPSAPGSTRGAAPRSDLVLRTSAADGLAKARRLVDEGDVLFRRQQFLAALQKYKQAASAAPETAEVYWRQGHALVAIGEYERAATVLKRALALEDDPDRGGFRLGALYGSAIATKEMHLERLAEWTLAHPHAADGYFLIGLALRYDGQAERAAKFFRRAGELSVPLRDLVAGLMADEAGLAGAASAEVPAGSRSTVPAVPVRLAARAVEL